MLSRRSRWHEILLVLGVSLGMSAVYSVLSLINKLTREARLADQQATLNPSVTPDRPWLDLAYQLAGVVVTVLPAFLAVYLLRREPDQPLATWPRRLSDFGWGVAFAAAIGLPGLGLYWLARTLGISAEVVPAALEDVWWSAPVLTLAAAANAILEEVVVVGYLITRLQAQRIRSVTAVAASATLRGSYHLYQGFGAFVGNAIMGALFGAWFIRTRRVGPLIVAHFLLDTVAFVGYALFRDKITFLR
jgi:membrane protease YdiL (CAAX protease family)